MSYSYEKVWVSINNVSSEQVQEFTKTDVYFMKNIGICFFIAELVFTCKEDVDTQIIIDLPEISAHFAACENTILTTKNDDIKSFVDVRLEKEKLILEAYPFTPSATYEVNVQLFLRIIDATKEEGEEDNNK